MSIQNIALDQRGMLERMQSLSQAADNAPVSTNALSGAAQSSTSFDDVMQHALRQVDNVQQRADVSQTAVDMGKSDDLAGAMLASQQASLSFSALVQVRNKLATGFNDLMSMSV